MARPKRARAVSKIESEPAPDEASAKDGVPDEAANNVHEDEPALKKRKTAGTKRPKKKVIPLQDTSAFGALCADVLIEIFSYLTPQDLLHLSWTSRGICSFLTCESMAQLWKNARTKNIPQGLPDCPKGMKESQYANILFGDHCFFCTKQYYSNELYVSWEGRFQVCLKCAKKKTLFVHRESKHPEENEWAQDYPYDYINLLPKVELPFGHGGSRTYYHLDTHEQWKEEYRTAKDKKNWLDAKRKEQTCNSAEYSSKFRTWNYEWKRYLCREREKMISNHLRKLGWQSELDKINPNFHGHPMKDSKIVKACENRLTETDLLNLEPHLYGLMRRIQAERLLRERQNLIRTCVPILAKVVKSCQDNYPPNFPTPNVADIFKLPFVLDEINSSDEQGLKEDALQPLIEMYPDIARQWKLEKETELLEMIKSSSGDTYTFDPNKVFYLATTIFSCSGCPNESMWYPRVLMHHHAVSCRPINSDSDTELMYQQTRSSSWNDRKAISFRDKDRLIMHGVLKEFGFDPETTTVEEMDVQDPIFECVPCNDIRKGRFTMKWSYLASHIASDHDTTRSNPQKPHKLEMLRGQEAECIRARFAEDNAVDRRYATYQLNDWMICGPCRNFRSKPVEMAEHLLEKHGIVDPADDDMVRNIDIVLPVQHRYSWPPRKVQRQQ